MLESVNANHIIELSQTSTRFGRLWVNLKNTLAYTFLVPISLLEGIIRIFTDFLAFFGVRANPEFRLVSYECVQSACDSVVLILDTLKTTPKRLVNEKPNELPSATRNDKPTSIITF